MTGKQLNKITLEDLLRMKVKLINKDDRPVYGYPDFRVAVQNIKEDRIHFLIHPIGFDGITLDFVVQGNELKFLVEEIKEEPEKE